MSTPKQALSNDELGRERISAESKDLRRFIPTGVSKVIVVVEDGYPTPQQVWVDRNGTVQLVNKDSTDYKLRLWTRREDTHADVDVLLPARGGVTLIVDPDTPAMGECYYELIPFEVSGLGRNFASATRMEFDTRGTVETVGGEATAEDTPLPRKTSVLERKGPGGGIITVP